MSERPATPVDALLLLAPGCPHCPRVLEQLGSLVKQSRLAALEVVNIALRPERAAALGVRSVPWVRMGELEFTGAHSQTELSHWAARAGLEEGRREYVEQSLKNGQWAQLESLWRRHPHWGATLLDIVADPDTAISVRLGAAALLEMEDTRERLVSALPRLTKMGEHADHRVRSDAVHLLSLTPAETAADLLRQHLRDPHAEVREIAADGLERLSGKA